MRYLRLVIAAFVLGVLPHGGSALAASGAGTGGAWIRGTVVVSYTTPGALERAVRRHGAAIVSNIPALRTAEIRPRGDVDRFAAAFASEPGIVGLERPLLRRPLVEPALVHAADGPPQWQHAAIGADLVPAEVAAAAAALTIAVIDTGADVRAPDLAAKAPTTWSVLGEGGAGVGDTNGHGTFVAALAAGSASNGEGVAGIAGDAKLMIVQAGGPTGSFTDVDEAAAIVSAVDKGANVINLSLGGPSTSSAERRAIDYAVAKGVLLVAAVGNGYLKGNPVEYPAALLQPVGSRGVGGRGLAVGASTRAGGRAAFSATGTHVSVAAPGEGVFSAVSSSSPRSRYPRTPLPGSSAGLYGYGSGTSFAAPQVAGAAALVWAANPRLRAADVAAVIEETASGGGAWRPDLGFGVVDVAAAVTRAQQYAAGTQRASAEPVTVSLRPAAARLSLRAVRAPGRVDLDARLLVVGAPGAEEARTVVLESFAGRRWSRAATGVTDADGRAVWSHALSAGSYRVRARYAGTADVAPATSAPVTLRLP